MAGPEDMILPLLREMRAEIAGFRDETRHGFELMDQRFRRLEEAQTSHRIEEREKKARELEAHK